jgi:murein L,D-transpeptidase YafK
VTLLSALVLLAVPVGAAPLQSADCRLKIGIDGCRSPVADSELPIAELSIAELSTANRQSPIVNRQSSIADRQSLNHQSAIVNPSRQSSIGNLNLQSAIGSLQSNVPTSRRAARAEREAAVRLTPRLQAQRLALGAPVSLRIFKEEQTLEVWLRDASGRFRMFASYPICTFSGEPGPKLARGDGQSPEGFYSVRPAALNPGSAYHLSFDLGYPNAYDRAHGRTGSALMVHGACVSIGCYAMTDPAIEEIWTLVASAFRGGQREMQVQAYPFRMTAAALDRRRADRWHGFWANLKEGHDLFERTGVPPRVDVRGGRYRFTPQP